MKYLAIIFTIISLTINFSFAENAEPTVKGKKAVELTHNGFNYLQVSINKTDDAIARVKIYNDDFTLLHTSSFRGVSQRNFNISQLKEGHYIIKVELDGEDIHTEAIKISK